MNILPLVLALVVILSILTVERMELFKNQAIVQREYRLWLKEGEREVFNRRQRSLYGETQKSIRQVTLRFLVHKEARERNPHAAAQYRQIIKNLIKVLYAETDFLPLLANRKGQGVEEFVDSLLDALERAGEEAPDKSLKRVQDVARLKLGDPDLQEAWYHMLKGTISRAQLKERLARSTPFDPRKAYVSLLHFIHYDGAQPSNPPRISLQRSPREILKAIFGNDETVEALIARRNELAANPHSGNATLLKEEFQGKVVEGLDVQYLSFEVSASSKDKNAYN